MRPDLEPIGRTERAIQPTLNKFSLNAELGLNTVLSPDASKATAEAFVTLARQIDLMDAERHAAREFLVSVAVVSLIFAAIIAVAFAP